MAHGPTLRGRSGELDKRAIAGIAIGVTVFSCFLILSYLMWMAKWKRKPQTHHDVHQIRPDSSTNQPPVENASRLETECVGQTLEATRIERQYFRDVGYPTRGP